MILSFPKNSVTDRFSNVIVVKNMFGDRKIVHIWALHQNISALCTAFATSFNFFRPSYSCMLTVYILDNVRTKLTASYYLTLPVSTAVIHKIKTPLQPL